MKLKRKAETTDAVFPLSADPITLGHVNLINRALEVFPKLTVLILFNNLKPSEFSLDERLELVKKSLPQKIKVITYRGLLADYLIDNEIRVVIRGIRNHEDFDYEKKLEQSHRRQIEAVEFFYLIADEKLSFIHSGLAKSILLEYGNVNQMVPVPVKKRMEEKMLGQKKILLTGGIHSGKSYLIKHLMAYWGKIDFEATHIDFDQIVTEIYQKFSLGQFEKVQTEMVGFFGTTILTHGQVDKKKLSAEIFSHPEAEIKRQLIFLEDLLGPLIHHFYRKQLVGRKGLIVLDAPVDKLSRERFDLLVEVNHQVLLVDVKEEVQIKRLQKNRKLTLSEAKKLVSVNSALQKKNNLMNYFSQQANADGFLIFPNEKLVTEARLKELTEQIRKL